MSDALTKVKTDLGRGAVILHTRTVKRGGVLGIGARSLVEVTATADVRLVAGRIAPTAGVSEANAAPVQSSSAAGAVAKAADSSAVTQEVREIRSMVEELLRSRPPSGDSPRRPEVPQQLVEHYTRLVGEQVAEELVREIVDRASRAIEQRSVAHWDNQGRPVGGQTATPETIRGELLKCIAEMLPTAEPLLRAANDRPTIVALVGPTGVGKTTTVAKLAANLKLREGRNVGLITIDSFRIAAVEQLRTYAQIMQIPIVAVVTPSEMEAALRSMSGLDMVLIDTAGRSQRDEPRIAELAEFLAAAKADEVHLVLSSTSREETIREAMEKFSAVGAKHVIFTKLDEAVGLGVILNVLRNAEVRLSYLTNGQSVPDDIEPGSGQRVAQLILGERT